MDGHSQLTGSSYKDILSAITAIKLNELKSQKTRLDAHYTKTLESTEDSPTLLEKLKILCQGVKEAPIPQETPALRIENIEVLILQASSDPSTSSFLLQYWIDRLKKDINRELKRSEYAYNFGLIMSEWLSSENTSTDADSWVEIDPSASSAEVKSAKLETEQQLHDMIFEEADVDPNAVKSFLTEEIFNLHSKEDKVFLDTVIKEVGKFGDGFCERMVTVKSVKYTIDGLLKSDLLPADKQSVLQEVRENDVILREFASVLNVMLRNVATWCWPQEGIPVDLRRGIKGKYRAFMEEDIITALFLQYIGAEWCAFLKKKFISIYDSNIWIKPDVFHDFTVVGHRQKLQRSTFLLSSLPDSIKSQSKHAYDEDEEDTFAEDDSTKRGMANIKHSLLHLMNVEARLHQTLKPDQGFTIVGSDFEWFGPSIPHSVILIFLEFFGVPKIWIKFFEQYLKTPVLLPSDKSLHTRQRGVPVSHLLSTIFAETILFGLDLYIVRSTGIFLYRIHDDLWFWDSDGSKVELAWSNMKKFSDIMGLKLNQEKSGSVTVFSAEKLKNIATSNILENELPSNKKDLKTDAPPIYYGQGSLPQDTVKWGLIVLHSDGAFHIDHPSMEKFIAEMENRLSAANSVVEWVNIFNKYMTFFLRSFGQFANVFEW
ncbi:hypothetical protein K7432_009384 [Basidiobolus ranarum]|uniref:Reverse transcriptase domain-containing protein n=1 Tax=Basidiobolus ranarum TaxID=34480 RepID=A0ABR2VX46_9FUNG